MTMMPVANVSNEIQTKEIRREITYLNENDSYKALEHMKIFVIKRFYVSYTGKYLQNLLVFNATSLQIFSCVLERNKTWATESHS